MFNRILTKLGLKPRQWQPPPEPYALDTPLFHWSKADTHTIRDSVCGVFVSGANGSGKSSGPSATFAKAHLAAGFGAVFHAVKPTDTQDALQWCRETGRLGNVLLLHPDQPGRFDVMDYERGRSGAGAGLTENIVNTILNIGELRDRGGTGGSGGENAAFFKNATKEILRAAVDVVSLGMNRISMPDINEVIVSAPTSMEQVFSSKFRDSSLLFHLLREADKREKTPIQRMDLEHTMAYWLKKFPQQSDRTRSGITSTVYGILDPFNRGILRQLFCSGTNFTPDDLRKGLVVIHGMSVKEYGEVGASAQVLFKYACQQALERHDVRANPRPVVLHIDEFHELMTSYDAKFAATCRGFKVSFVLLTQNLPTIYSTLGGGDKAKQDVDSLLGNMNLKIFCANSEATTNEWASNVLGRTRQYMSNMNSGDGQDDAFATLIGTGRSKASTGMTETFEYQIQPGEWSTRLRTGGPENKFEVDAVIFANARKFKLTNCNWMVVTFNQK